MRGRLYHHDVYKTLLVLIFLFPAGCGSRYEMVTKGIQDIDSMKTVIEEYIPLDSSANRGRKFLYDEKFTCFDKDEYENPEYEGQDYIFCERRDGGMIVFDRWVVVLIKDDNTVQEIKVDKNYFDMIK